MSDWWLSRASGAPEGPYPTQTLVQGLNSGQIQDQAYVCRVGDQRWIRISQIDEIWNAAYPEQDKTQVIDQPWFQKATNAQPQLQLEANTLDNGDENPRTQNIAPITVVASDAPSCAVITPLPRTSTPNVGPSRVTAAPLPRPRPPLQRSAPPHTVVEPTPENPVLPKVPTLEGIQTPSLATLPPKNFAASGVEATRLTVMRGVATPPIPDRNQAGPTTPMSQISTPIPDRRNETRASTPQQPSIRGLSGIGLSALPKAASVAGLGALPSPPKTSQATQSAVSISPNPVSNLLATTDIIALAKASAAKKQIVAPISGVSDISPMPGATSTSKSVVKAEASLDIPQGLPASLPSPTPLNVTLPTSLLDDSDIDEVTTIASTGPVPPTVHGCLGVVQEVTAVVVPQRLRTDDERRPAARTEETQPTHLSTTVKLIPPEVALPDVTALPELDFSARRAPVANRTTTATEPASNPPPVPPTPQSSAFSHVPKPVATSETLKHNFPTDSIAPNVGQQAQALSTSNTERASEIEADSFELLEEDTDDPSMPIHIALPLPRPSSSLVRREKTETSTTSATSGGQEKQVSGPIITLPPKATRQEVPPTIVLRPEPVVHQESTKPGVRALRPRGVVQVTYGTLVIAILGVALLFLMLVLLLK